MRVRINETGAEARVTSFCFDGSNLFYLSYFTRVKSNAESISSSVLLGRMVDVYDENDEYNCVTVVKDKDIRISAYHSRLTFQKESFYHTIIFPTAKKEKNLFVVENQEITDGLYSKLMELYDLPLLHEWMNELYGVLIHHKHLILSKIIRFDDQDEYLKDTFIARLELTQEELDGIISRLIMMGRIKLLSEEKLHDYSPLEIEGLDEFYAKYGEEIVDAAVEDIQPLLSEPIPRMDNIVLMDKILFPSQAYVANGLSAALDKYNTAFLIATMGTGKTLLSLATTEDYFVRKYMRRYPHATKEEAIENVSYRTIVVAPGHLLEKWKYSIEADVPGAKVTILDSFNKVTNLYKLKGNKPKGKEIFVIGKDFMKLSYMQYPLVKDYKKVVKKEYYCSECSAIITKDTSHCDCGGKVKFRVLGYEYGISCPHCNHILKDNKGNSLKYSDFKNQNNVNSTCSFCGSSLWAPLTNDEQLERCRYERYKVYANAAKNSSKTIWVKKGFHGEYSEVRYGLFEPSKALVLHRTSPSQYIKRKLGRNFFDMVIGDEVHKFKAGGSAQGNSFMDIVKCSKKVIALTGTIAAGYAQDVFYLLWRLKPWYMVQQGYSYHDVFAFSDNFGTVEAMYELEGNHNKMSKGRQLGTPRAKPGISPLIYTDFFYADTVHLDIDDLSNYMPAFNEYVELCKMDSKQRIQYNFIAQKFRDVIMDGDGGSKLSSKMIQTLLAYPDKPYGFSDILHPESGNPVICFDDYEPVHLLPKEKMLVERINSELEEGRNMFVFVEFTAQGEKYISSKLKQVIEDNCPLSGTVEILESSSPGARDREAYIHRKAETKGTRVFITNPKLIETGLDFIWYNDKGEMFNYPTLYFYQIGTDFNVSWQASRRGYRLIQTEECRVYYSAYEDTMQQQLLKLMGDKKMATSVVQGKFSASALSTDSIKDVRYQLIQSLQDNIKIDTKTIDAQFKKLNEMNNQRTLTEEEKGILEAMKQKKADVLREKRQSILNAIGSAFNDFFDDGNGASKVPISPFDLPEDAPPNEVINQNNKKNIEKTFGQINLFG